ncbi:MAG: hypothetical protein Q4D81_11710 [Eubacteriales bacterium]|nr:hypothetical protein [Eubacteriales bacterium]
MSCWHYTVVLRIPASALGFKSLREWNEFLRKHEDDFSWEEDCFCESLSEDFPLLYSRGWRNNKDPDRQLDQRDPEHPDIVPGPFLDYYLRDDYPLQPDDNSFGEINEIRCLDESDMKEYLPVYQSLFPHFTLKDMEAVRECIFEYYDGSDAPYLYSYEWY